MDLSHYYKHSKGREEIARRNCAWLIEQFEPDETLVNCKISWEDVSRGYAESIGDHIVGMLYSSGYWANFRVRNFKHLQKITLYFEVVRMTAEELESERKQWKDAGEDSEDDKIDDPPADVATK